MSLPISKSNQKKGLVLSRNPPHRGEAFLIWWFFLQQFSDHSKRFPKCTWKPMSFRWPKKAPVICCYKQKLPARSVPKNRESSCQMTTFAVSHNMCLHLGMYPGRRYLPWNPQCRWRAVRVVYPLYDTLTYIYIHSCLIYTYLFIHDSMIYICNNMIYYYLRYI